MENVNTTLPEVITDLPPALPDVLVGAENFGRRLRTEIDAAPGSIYKTGQPCKTAPVPSNIFFSVPPSIARPLEDSGSSSTRPKFTQKLSQDYTPL
jgi:hypothetical protein